VKNVFKPKCIQTYWFQKTVFSFGMKHSSLHYLDDKTQCILMNTFFGFLKGVKYVLAYKQKSSPLSTLQSREEDTTELILGSRMVKYIYACRADKGTLNLTEACWTEAILYGWEMSSNIFKVR
jgi:hypothetical protein